MIEELIQMIDEYAQTEHDHSVRLLRSFPDGSVELQVRFMDDGDAEPFEVVVAEVGEFRGHRMIEIREEPPVIVNAIPRMIVAVLLEL